MKLVKKNKFIREAPREKAMKLMITTGERFADGSAIELVSSRTGSSKPDLLLWRGSSGTIATTVQHLCGTYEAPLLQPTVYDAIQLPAMYTDYGSLSKLFSDLEGLFKDHLQLPHRESSLLAAFALSTWIADVLPLAPGAMISAPEEVYGIELLRLLNCICYHPLLLAEVTATGLRSLPMRMGLTLLINQQSIKSSLQRVLRMSTYRGFHSTGHGGSVVDLYGPKVILCGGSLETNNLGDAALKISVIPSPSSQLLDSGMLKNIAANFQPRLLQYRLNHLATGGSAQTDLSSFTSTVRPLASAFGICLRDDEKLAHETVSLLRFQDEVSRGDQLLDVNRAAVDVLWGLAHESTRSRVQVAQLADYVNALLASRGDSRTYSAEEVGWLLSKLGIRRSSSSAGRQVLLNPETKERVHRLARGYRLHCAEAPQGECKNCQLSEIKVST